MSFIHSPQEPAARSTHSTEPAEPEQRSPVHDQEGPAAALCGARILLAEDDAVMREYARLLLMEHGSHVELAANGAEALSLMKSNPPDLALLDLIMPHMTGIEVLEEVRADDDLRTLPVIMLSGQKSEEAKLAGFRAGANDYLTKPYSERELLARVGGQLAMSRMRNEMLYRERQLRAEADLLNEVALELTSELDPRSLVQKVTDLGTRLTGAMYGAYFYRPSDEREDGLQLYALSGDLDREQFDALGMPSAADVFGSMLRGEGALRMDDVMGDPRHSDDVLHRDVPNGHLPARSLLAVPVFSQGQGIIGGLCFGHPEPSFFDERSERFAEGIAAQAAVAIDNARLYARAKKEIDDRTRAEDALRESQERYAQLVHALPAAVYTCDAEGRVQLFNEAAVRLWGRTPTAGTDMWSGSYRMFTVEGHSLPLDECSMAVALREGRAPENREVIIESPDGRRRNVLPHPIPLRDSDGNFIGAVNMLLDITERKEAEASRGLLAAIVESSTDAVIGMTVEGEISSWNAAAEALFGYSAEEAIGRPFTILTPTERRAEESELFERICRGERIGHRETVRLSKSGRRIGVSLTVSPVEDADGRVIGISKIARDITAHNKMKRALERSEQQLRLVIDALPAMVSYVDRDTRYRFFNRQLRELFGLDPGYLQGRTMAEVMGADAYEVIRPHVEKTLSGELTQFEIEMPGRDGEMRILEVTYAPDIGLDGRVEGFIGLLNDITVRKRTEREIERLNRDLRARVHELETLQEMIPVGVVTAHDADCTVITANHAGKLILSAVDRPLNLSQTGSGAARLPFRLLRDGEEVAPDKLPIQRSARTGEEVSGELYDQVFEDGTVKQIQISASPLRDPDGNPRGCIATIVDITENIRAERAVRESEARFRMLTMNAPAAIYIKDLEGVYRMANPLACTYLGRKEVVGLSDHDLMEREWADRLREHDLRVTVTEQALELEEKVHVHGVTHEFLSAKFPMRNAEGRPTGVCGVSVDITARKRAENALRQTIARTSLMAGVSEQLLTANDPLPIANRLCKEVAAFLDCDVFSVRLLDESTGLLHLKTSEGISDAEMLAVESTEVGMSMSGNVVQEGRPRIASHLQSTTDPERLQARLLGLQAYACHPLQVGGRVIGTLSFASRTRSEFPKEDIDLMKTVADQVAIAMERLSVRQALLDVNATLEERVRERTIELIEQRRQLQRLAAELTTAEQRERKRLASLLHDDLQQLLVSAKMLMGTIGRRRDDPDDLLATCTRVQKLIDDSIDAARDMSRQLRPPVLYEDGLVPALRWLASEMHRIHDLEIVVTSAEDVEPADDDQRAFLFECVRELLLNIVKHAGVQEAYIEARRAEDNVLQIVVRDAGRGFDLNAGTLDKQNEGFGLFSIRERLASIGGRIAIESSPGNGTTTTIEAPMVDVQLPKDRPLLESKSFRQVHRSAHGQEKRVLVVDDHALVREGIATVIGEDDGFCVVGQASDGLEAIRAMETCHPEIVLMDLNMPRMNGIEATRVIRRQWPGTIIVGLSVQEDETTARSVVEAGASVFLSKSSTPDQIVATMRELVSKHHHGA